jgi:hypothetical protein
MGIHFEGLSMNVRTDRELFDNIHKGITEGIEKAVQEHKRAGRSIVVWEDGKIVNIPADKIAAIVDK